MSALKVAYATWDQQGPGIAEAVCSMLRAIAAGDSTEVTRLLGAQLPDGMTARTALAILRSTPEHCAQVADSLDSNPFWLYIAPGRPRAECRVSLQGPSDHLRRVVFSVKSYEGRWTAIPDGRAMSCHRARAVQA